MIIMTSNQEIIFIVLFSLLLSLCIYLIKLIKKEKRFNIEKNAINVSLQSQNLRLSDKLKLLNDELNVFNGLLTEKCEKIVELTNIIDIKNNTIKNLRKKERHHVYLLKRKGN
ncbi:MAG: hypothetical protein CMC55_08795 [Flavobacteriaceae bacterium]|nr:hypothetical protein [Flavobacteriaceae bacterium]|tara:strand:- start:558 stop:896 length:339 start_codon:yes stop_codon:yes gene_type:complete